MCPNTVCAIFIFITEGKEVQTRESREGVNIDAKERVEVDKECVWGDIFFVFFSQDFVHVYH
jgi:hypothetical protein